jgi:hypothetical protein
MKISKEEFEMRLEKLKLLCNSEPYQIENIKFFYENSEDGKTMGPDGIQLLIDGVPLDLSEPKKE